MTSAARSRAQIRSPILAVSAAAWAFLAAFPAKETLHLHHAHHGAAGMLAAQNAFGSATKGWAIMLVAMMFPLLIAPVRHIRDRSFANRRNHLTALFVAGYMLVWMVAGQVMTIIVQTIQFLDLNARAKVALTLTGALVWQFSPLKQRCLNQGHVHPPIPAFGLSATVHALRFGLVHGWWCVGSCWALMLIPMLMPSAHLAVMALVSLWIWGEHFNRAIPPTWRFRVPDKGIRLTFAQLRLLLSPK